MANLSEKSYPRVAITNTLASTLNVYSTLSKVQSSHGGTEAMDYYPIYTLLGSISAKSKKTIQTILPLSRLVMTRQHDDFPVKLYVTSLLKDEPASVTITQKDEAACETAWCFYQKLIALPYSPLSLAYQSILLKNRDSLESVASDTNQFLKKNGYACDYFAVNLVTYWQANCVAACRGTYYCYGQELGDQSDSLRNIGFLISNRLLGKLIIDEKQAVFTSQADKMTKPLSYHQNKLFSEHASLTKGITLQGVLRSLKAEGKPSEIKMCFFGKKEGLPFIANPYPDIIPWQLWAYDLVYLSFVSLQAYMLLEMLIQIGSAAISIFSNISGFISALCNSLKAAWEAIHNVGLNVSRQGIRDFIKSFSNWIMKHKIKLIKFLLTQTAFITFGIVVNELKKTAKQKMLALKPKLQDGLSLLIHYMLLPSDKIDDTDLSIKARWELFAKFVQEEKPDISVQKFILNLILATKNKHADKEAAHWRWRHSRDEEALILAMLNYKEDHALAYQELAHRSENQYEKVLPIKVACAVAIRFLNKLMIYTHCT